MISAVQSQSIPYVFYDQMSLLLTVPGNSLSNAVNDNVSFVSCKNMNGQMNSIRLISIDQVSLLFRLDYSMEGVEDWEKETD